MLGWLRRRARGVITTSGWIRVIAVPIAEKPEPLCASPDEPAAAYCRELPNGERMVVVADLSGPANSEGARAIAEWFLRAAAWCAQGRECR